MESEYKALVKEGIPAATAANVALKNAIYKGDEPDILNERRRILFPDKVLPHPLLPKITCINRTTVVAMYPKKRASALALPESVQGKSRPDAGWVLETCSSELSPGDTVLVMPFAGNWFSEAVLSGIAYEEVRVYGIHSPDEHTKVLKPIGESIVAALSEEMKVQAVETNVYIRRDPNITHENGIQVKPYRPQTATVISVGAKCQDLKPGDRVFYHAPGVIVDTSYAPPEYEGDDPSAYCFIDECHVYAII